MRKKLLPIEIGIETNALFVHLAPGGNYLVVEETVKDKSQKRTGRLFIYDGMRGTLVKEVADPMVASMNFLALTPNGRAVYNSDGSFRIVKLGMQFGTEKVTRVVVSGVPNDTIPFFFASR